MNENRIRLDSVNPGTYICMRTNKGNVSELQIVSLTDTLELHVRTWHQP